MKVSILIAIYNAEKYLRECLDSLLRQTHTDWEAVCVDDCSTDSSPDIVRQYAESDSRFKLIQHTVNQGQAKARNTGIGSCDGDLVCFLDSDDYFLPSTLSECVRVFESHDDADCVLMRCVKFYENGEKEELRAEADFPIQGDKAFELSLDWTIHGIYMTRMSIQRQIPYDDTCRSFSDDNTTRLHYLASRGVYMSEGVYMYRHNNESVSNVISIRRLDFLLANEHMQHLLEDMGAETRLLRLHERVRWLNLIGCYRLVSANKDRFSRDDYTQSMALMKRIWTTIDVSLIPPSTRLKPGYATLPTWTLFRLQQWLYMFFKHTR